MKITTYETVLEGFQIRKSPIPEDGGFEVVPGVEVRGDGPTSEPVRRVRVVVAEVDGKSRASVQLIAEDGNCLVVIGAEALNETDTSKMGSDLDRSIPNDTGERGGGYDPNDPR